MFSYIYFKMQFYIFMIYLLRDIRLYFITTSLAENFTICTLAYAFLEDCERSPTGLTPPHTHVPVPSQEPVAQWLLLFC